MRVIHYCLSSFYIDGMNYQENALIREHVKAGHEVLVIASTENMDENKNLCYSQPSEYIGDEGAQVIRLPYRGWPHKLARKLRIHPNVYGLTEKFKPDALMFHSMCGWEILTVAKYVRNHPKTIFYADSHEDKYNSAQGFLSREILHKRYYAPIARRAMAEIIKVLCVNLSSQDFLRDMYRLPNDKLEFFPLAGNPKTWEVITKVKAYKRHDLGLSEDNILIVQSGKQTIRKKLLESLKAFIQTKNPAARFFVVGTLFEDIKDEATALMSSDERIQFLGWKTSEELTEILCAADVYLQPGTQSATMQNSLCSGCAIIIDNDPAHVPFFNNNGWLVRDTKELESALIEATNGKLNLDEMKKNSLALAQEFLNYEVQAKRILRPL